MPEFILVVILMGLSFIVGGADRADTYQTRCEAKYADMPHNKVEDHCKTILKFEEDPK